MSGRPPRPRPAVGAAGSVRGARYRRRVLAYLLGGLLVLLVVLAAADLLIERRAKDRMTDALRCISGDSSLDPDISLGGTPVLVQAISGRFATIRVADVPATALLPAPDETSDTGGDNGNDTGTIRDLLAGQSVDLTLHDVGLGSPASIGSVTASDTIGWDILTETLGSAGNLGGATLGEQDGQLAVTLAQQVMGQPLEILMTVTADGSAVVLTPETVVLGSRQVRATLLSGLVGGLGNGDQNPLEPRTVDLDLPDGANLSAASVESGGLRVDLAMTSAGLAGATGSGCLG